MRSEGSLNGTEIFELITGLGWTPWRSKRYRKDLMTNDSGRIRAVIAKAIARGGPMLPEDDPTGIHVFARAA